MLRTLLTNKVDGSTITAPVGGAMYDINNLKDDILSNQWKPLTLVANQCVLHFDLKSAYPIDHLAFAGHDLYTSHAGVVDCRLLSSPDDATWTVELLFQPPSDYTIGWNFTQKSARYWKIEFNGMDYLPSIGRVFLGTYYDIPFGADLDANLELVPLSNLHETLPGTMYVDERSFKWQFSCDIRGIDRPGIVSMRDSLSRKVIVENFWLIIDSDRPSGPDESGSAGDYEGAYVNPDIIFGKLVSPWTETQNLPHDMARYSTSLVFREDL